MTNENTGKEMSTMNLEDLINTSSAGGGIILTIIAGMIILLPILIIIAIFNISSNSTKLTKQMELLNKQMDYLLQLEERKQGIPNTQNIPQNNNISGFDTRQ